MKTYFSFSGKLAAISLLWPVMQSRHIHSETISAIIISFLSSGHGFMFPQQDSRRLID